MSSAPPERAEESPSSEETSSSQPCPSADGQQSDDVELTDSLGDISADEPKPEREFTPSPLAPSEPDSDRYGWTVSRPLTDKEQHVVEIWEKKEKDRARKWRKMFENFTKFRIYHRDVFERRVKKGIPDAWRARAWVWILDRTAEKEAQAQKRERKDVSFYFDKAIPESDEVIKNDIPRTMPSNSLFSEEETRARFYRILRAYANASRDGYVQGMAFPAAMLIAYIPDDYEVFWAFMHMMDGERLGLSKMYRGKFDGLRDLNQVWACILNHKFRAVANHLEEEGVQDMMYTPTYFLCAFMGCQFPTFLRLRIFDRFICCGFRALVSLALVFIKLNRRLFSEGELEDILPLLKNPTCDDFSLVLKEWDKEWMSEEEFDKWCAKANVALKKNPKRMCTL